MDPIKYGAFIASLRKEAGLTQQEVAAYLGIANKTVSKWECGRGYPDITLLPAIGELYSITVDELLACKKNAEVYDAAITKPQDTQISHQAQARSCAIFKIAGIAFWLSLVSSLLFFILEKYLLFPFLYLLITALCVISIIIARVAYRKALHFLQGIHSANQYGGAVKNFISAFVLLYSAAISLAAYAFVQVTLYCLWVKENKNYRFFEHHYTAMRHGCLLVDHLKIKKRCVYEVGEK